MTLFFDEADAATLITPLEAVDCLGDAFSMWKTQGAQSSPRQRLALDGGSYNVMSAVYGQFFGAKSYFAAPFGRGYHILLYGADTAQLLGLIEAQALSQLRTGAATGLATRYLSRPEASVLGQIGTGRQALNQILCVLAVRDIKQIRLFGRSAEKLEAFATMVAERCDVDVVPCTSAEACVRGSDIVTAITNAKEPVLMGDWLASGTHVNLVGANSVARREADDQTIARASTIVTDDKAQARMEAAELIAAPSSDIWERVTELGDLISAGDFVRNASDITVFKSLGIALEDVALAAAIYRKARQQGRGRALNV